MIKKGKIAISIILFFGLSSTIRGQVHINEIRSDDSGTDDIEFIELVGLSGTNLTDYQLKFYNGSSTVDGAVWTHTIGTFTIPDDGITDSGSNSIGFYVLSLNDSVLANTDETISDELQNGPDGLILFNAEGNIIDAVAWDGAGDLTDDDPGTVTTSGVTSADNYLHVTANDDSGDNSLQAPDDVIGDDGSGWTIATSTIGSINSGQTSGSVVLEASVKAEPANHVTSFTATGEVNSISLSWSDATGSPAPDAYLIKISESGYGSISMPIDENAETNDTDLSDGSGVLNIAQGTESSSLTGLSESTTYYFKIFPYTNTGSDIDYKTDGTIPEDTATTLITPDIVLNEILADPAGDANGDGTTDTGDDEFLEFVNTGNSNLDISNWTIEDALNTTHTFDDPTILKPMQAIVVFGGGTPTGDFGGSMTQTAGGLSLNNGGDDLILKNDSGVEIINYTYGGATDQSETRSPDLTGDFADHTSADTDDGSAFSPGTRIDGSTFQPSVEITGSEGWRILSTPTASSTYDDLLGDIWTQGIATGADATEGTANVQVFNGSSFSGISDMGTTMIVGNGFIVYMYSDDDYTESVADAGFPKTLEIFAVPNSGAVSPALNSGAEAWTLVGNPYYSTIDWDEVLLNSGTNQLSGTVYVYDHSYGTPSGDDVTANGSAGSYRVWNGSAGSLTDGLIAPFQGFWIQNAVGATSESFEINEDDKTTGGTFYKKSDESISIKLRGEMENMYNESFLSFTGNGEVAKDNYDGLKLSPLDFRSYLSVASVTGDTKMDINNLPKIFENELSIPVSVEAYSADTERGSWVSRGGEVTLTWPEMKNLPDEWSITLNDSKTGAVVNMRTTEEYVFDLSETQKAKTGPVMTIFNPQPPQVERIAKKGVGARFTITIGANSSVNNEIGDSPEAFALEQNYPNPFNPTTSIQYSLAHAGEVQLDIYNVMGQQVETLVSGVKSAGNYRVSWDAADMASGIYYYRLKAGKQVVTRQMTLIK